MSSYLEFKRYKGFEKDILPKIDVLAAEQNRTRSDIIRDILYAKFGYEPKTRSQDQISEDHIEERKEEVEQKYKCIVVRVDKEYRWMFFKRIIEMPGRMDHNYRRTLNQTLYDYFKIETPKYLE